MSIGNINTFVEDMSSGKGWIALAALSFGRWSPLGVLAAAMLFGLTDAFQLRMQIAMSGAPYQYFQDPVYRYYRCPDLDRTAW